MEPKWCGFDYMVVLQTSSSLLDLKMLLGGHVTRRLAPKPGDGRSITMSETSSSDQKYDVGQAQRDQFTGQELAGVRDGQGNSTHLDGIYLRPAYSRA